MEPVHSSLCPTYLFFRWSGPPVKCFSALLRAPPTAHPPGIHGTRSLADGFKLPLPVEYSPKPLYLIHFRQGVQGCVFLLCVGCSFQLPSTISKIRRLFLSGINSRSLCLLSLIPVGSLRTLSSWQTGQSKMLLVCHLHNIPRDLLCWSTVFKFSRNLQFI